MLERARAEPSELEIAIFDLRASVGDTIKQVRATCDSKAQAAIRKLVLAVSKEELSRERALVVDMGFESDPTAVPPPIEAQLPLVFT